MFESIRTDDATTRLRNAAMVPLAAFLFAEVYSTATPFLPRVPAALFWCIVTVVVAGAVAGAVQILRVVRREPIRGRAIAWLIAALACDLVCVRLAVAMIFPWV